MLITTTGVSGVNLLLLERLNIGLMYMSHITSMLIDDLLGLLLC
jgi:hypothetical protein